MRKGQLSNSPHSQQPFFSPVLHICDHMQYVRWRCQHLAHLNVWTGKRNSFTQHEGLQIFETFSKLLLSPMLTLGCLLFLSFVVHKAKSSLFLDVKTCTLWKKNVTAEKIKWKNHSSVTAVMLFLYSVTQRKNFSELILRFNPEFWEIHELSKNSEIKLHTEQKQATTFLIY